MILKIRMAKGHEWKEDFHTSLSGKNMNTIKVKYTEIPKTTIKETIQSNTLKILIKKPRWNPKKCSSNPQAAKKRDTEEQENVKQTENNKTLGVMQHDVSAQQLQDAPNTLADQFCDATEELQHLVILLLLIIFKRH